MELELVFLQEPSALHSGVVSHTFTLHYHIYCDYFAKKGALIYDFKSFVTNRPTGRQTHPFIETRERI